VLLVDLSQEWVYFIPTLHALFELYLVAFPSVSLVESCRRVVRPVYGAHRRAMRWIGVGEEGNGIFADTRATGLKPLRQKKRK
jgi:hypothetical protein